MSMICLIKAFHGQEKDPYKDKSTKKGSDVLNLEHHQRQIIAQHDMNSFTGVNHVGTVHKKVPSMSQFGTECGTLECDLGNMRASLQAAGSRHTSWLDHNLVVNIDSYMVRVSPEALGLGKTWGSLGMESIVMMCEAEVGTQVMVVVQQAPI